jgi:hypothetical protein
LATDDEVFESIRRDPDPARQGRRATELLGIYQRRTIELARLRREATRRLQVERGMSYAAIAEAFGLSKGRIGQINQVGPTVERVLFGVGPVTVAVPLRAGQGRALPVIASEDALASERLTTFLHELAFEVERFHIPVDGQWTPHGDTVAICGPKSSPVTAHALEADPILDFHEGPDRRWVIEDRTNGRIYRSPMDDEPADQTSDTAYLGRLPLNDGAILVIAGVHALGSVGAVDYLTHHLADLYNTVGTRPFSMVTRSRHDGERVIRSEALCPPRVHR